MGLAASQARLLTITARKSDCEYESMRLSHQKIALSRELNEVSNEYQNALNQTNLYYDLYGTGDTSYPLTYGLLTTPSALNDYLPTLVTNQQGRIVLDSKYAAAALKAGIPQEGLGGLPSDEVRNTFVDALFQNGLISSTTRDAIQSTTYNQAAGLGSAAIVSTITAEYTLSELKDYLQYSGDAFTVYVPASDVPEADNKDQYLYVNGKRQTPKDYADISVYDLLNGSNNTYFKVYSKKNGAWTDIPKDANTLLEELIGQFEEYFGDLLDTSDGITANALSYATMQTQAAFIYNDNHTGGIRVHEGGSNQDDYKNKDVMGWAVDGRHSTATRCSRSNYSINLSNILEAYLTYFAQYMDGVATSGGDYEVKVPAYKSNSSLIQEDFVFKVVTGESISSDDAKNSLFYDTFFNQLCISGWTLNNEVNDKEYLQEMLKNGMMYISTMDDDNYYIQGNYSTNKLIKEISDDSAIAAAEANYQTQKARLSSKEDEIDLKMKNLDTEISALTTEYDSVKSVITKNIEKSFKRYNA